VDLSRVSVGLCLLCKRTLSIEAEYEQLLLLLLQAIFAWLKLLGMFFCPLQRVDYQKIPL
jgi:hypothetical protein